MSGNDCPVCDGGFDSAGAVRDHAWEAHGVCHYCGDRVDGDEKAALYRHWLVAHPDDLSRRDRSQAENEVDSITFGDRLSNGGVGAAVRGLPRRAFLVGGGVLAIGGVAAGGVALRNALGGTEEIQTEEAGPVGTAPIPVSPGEYDYAVMGSADAAATVTYFGSWKCPACAQFDEGFFPTLVSDYVAPGDLRIEFRHIATFDGEPFLGPDAPNAGHAGLAVWNTDPGAYWRFHEVVFRNQPPEAKRWATPRKLEAFAEAAGVSDPGAVRTAVENDEYADELQATDRRATQVGVSGTPTLRIGNSLVSPSNQQQTRNRIEDAISNA
ncbi:thioredoxin [Halorientalis sp. IM1011]|uniref:DsbA family protein n=1 Tax=Halorientalis sp. IM1011 TaxID=1932360 RepID=UPI00097CC538|nr:DsbA family protein [Halorientalis sp. IM1011]AQL42617.1 thioredoxin [Halorientalis sp. IM1011]